jgi:hypothetical protein
MMLLCKKKMCMLFYLYQGKRNVKEREREREREKEKKEEHNLSLFFFNEAIKEYSCVLSIYWLVLWGIE